MTKGVDLADSPSNRRRRRRSRFEPHRARLRLLPVEPSRHAAVQRRRVDRSAESVARSLPRRQDRSRRHAPERQVALR